VHSRKWFYILSFVSVTFLFFPVILNQACVQHVIINYSVLRRHLTRLQSCQERINAAHLHHSFQPIPITLLLQIRVKTLPLKVLGCHWWCCLRNYHILSQRLNTKPVLAQRKPSRVSVDAQASRTSSHFPIPSPQRLATVRFVAV